MERVKYYSGTPWEKTVAYSRITKLGPHVFVSGTTAVNDKGEVVGDGDVYEQTSFIFNKIKESLENIGANITNVVRTRTFITNIDAFDEFSRAHAETFAGIDPAATCVEVTRLVDKRLLVEIEVDAIVEGTE